MNAQHEQTLTALSSSIIENLSDIVLLVDITGTIKYANTVAKSITGYSVEELIGQPLAILWKSFTQEAWAKIVTDKKVYQGESLAIKKDRCEFAMQIRILPAHQAGEKSTEYLIFIRDISAQKETEAQVNSVLNDLQERSQKITFEKLQYESLLVNIADGIVATDSDGIITTINHSAEKLLGWEINELTGKQITDFVTFTDEKKVAIPLFKTPIVVALSTGKKVDIAPSQTYYLKRKDGTHFPVGLSATPFIFNNRIIGTILVFRDITIEKNIDQAKSEFVNFVAHQLRTPLTSVNWYTEMLLSDTAGKMNQEQEEMVKVITESNKKMIDMINTLLNVSRLELGTFVIDPKPVDLITVAKDVLAELKVGIVEKKLTIVTDFVSEQLPIEADPNLLRIVFQNLLSNAVKYSPKEGKITLSVKKSPQEYIVSVADTGFGIPKANQSKIFQKMYRADNVKTVEGTGLGLYIVKQIIDNSNGTITFESIENKGTTFIFTLPSTGMPKRDGSKSLT